MKPDNETSKSNLGVPKATFIEDIDHFMKENEGNSEVVMKKLEENYRKYKLMEANLNEKKKRLMQQVPELESTYDIVQHLDERKESKDTMNTKFLLAGSLYAKATIPPTDEVCLWLGANVMLSYKTVEALKLIKKNLEAAKQRIVEVNQDIAFLRYQLTTSEVSMAQVYNWDVKNKRNKPKAEITQ